jgi:hypothetical protein
VALVGVPRAGGASTGLKTACLAAGMAAGADSIDEMDLLRHGAMDKVFDGVRAPSMPGSFLRAFTCDDGASGPTWADSPTMTTIRMTMPAACPAGGTVGRCGASYGSCRSRP